MILLLSSFTDHCFSFITSADNPSLKREDLKMIAVLAIPNPKQPENKSLGRQRVQSLNSISSLVTATSEDEFAIGKPPFIPSRKSSLGEEEDWNIQTPSSMTMQQGTQGMTIPEIFQQSSHNIDSSQPQSPARIQYLYSKTHNHARKQRRAVVVHSDAVSFWLVEIYFPTLANINFCTLIHTFLDLQDINPLRPCGACNEWLKKVRKCC